MLSPNSPRKPLPLGIGRNRHLRPNFFKDIFSKAVKNLPEKWYNSNNERTVVGAEFSAKALVENVAT